MQSIRFLSSLFLCVLSSALSAAPQTGTLTAVELSQFSGAPGGSTNFRFGRGIVVDGDTLLCASGGPNMSTQLDAFVRGAGTWTHQADLTTGSFYESGMALAGDLGLVGMPNNGPTTTPGRVLVARRTGTTWSTSFLDAPDPNTSWKFGAHVAIDGTTVVVSSPWYTHNFLAEGALYIYEDTGSTLVLRQALYGEKAEAFLGWRVALHGGDLLANFEDDHISDLRAFQRRGTQWEQTQRALGLNLGDLDPVSRVEMDDWGLAVVMPDFGGFIVLASTGDGVWFRDATFPGTPPGTQADMQLSDGVFALNAYADPTVAIGAGAVYLYARNNGWKMMRKLTAADGHAYDRFGLGIELRGSRLFVGADGDDDFGTDNGAVYEYELQFDPARVYCVPQISAIGCVPHVGFDGVPSATSSAPFTLKASKIPSHRPGFFVYGTSGAQFQALGTSVRCFAAPRFVTAHQLSGGTSPAFDCTGKFQFDCNAFIQSGIDPQLIAGTRVHGQFVARDPHNPAGISATDAVEFTILP